MNKRQRKKAQKKYFESEAFADYMRAAAEHFFATSDTPLLRWVLGDKKS